MRGEVLSKVGQIFEIVLAEPATAGYRWSITRLAPELHLVGNERKAASGHRLGKALQHIFRLRGSRPGEYAITFELRRPWERQRAEKRTLKVTLSP
jgi:predicted secreted protein